MCSQAELGNKGGGLPTKEVEFDGVVDSQWPVPFLCQYHFIVAHKEQVLFHQVEIDDSHNVL